MILLKAENQLLFYFDQFDIKKSDASSQFYTVCSTLGNVVSTNKQLPHYSYTFIACGISAFYLFVTPFSFKLVAISLKGLKQEINN
jgi:hypothetical protein